MTFAGQFRCRTDEADPGMAKRSGDSEVTQEETPRKDVCRGGGEVGWVDCLHQHEGQWEQKPGRCP